ncbi:MAG TPA: hypothetical protein VJL83_00945 [Patescibacteria group bacterium]|nr:hypothetical protein [Patescibacteria group bacterium]
MFNKVKDWYKGLPDQKKYFELVTAFLSIPVLLSVFLTNLNNLNRKAEESPPPIVAGENDRGAVTVVPIEIARERYEETSTVFPTATPNTEISPSLTSCKRSVGPVEIRSPREGERVTRTPVYVVIGYQIEEYCAVVWSYRINGGSWSEFDDKSIALYDMQPGEKVLELRVKSIASSDEVLLDRRFTYDPEDNASSSLSPSPTATESASLL